MSVEMRDGFWWAQVSDDANSWHTQLSLMWLATTFLAFHLSHSEYSTILIRKFGDRFHFAISLRLIAGSNESFYGSPSPFAIEFISPQFPFSRHTCRMPLLLVLLLVPTEKKKTLFITLFNVTHLFRNADEIEAPSGTWAGRDGNHSQHKIPFYLLMDFFSAFRERFIIRIVEGWQSSEARSLKKFGDNKSDTFGNVEEMLELAEHASFFNEVVKTVMSRSQCKVVKKSRYKILVENLFRT